MGILPEFRYDKPAPDPFIGAGFVFTLWAGYLISRKLSNNEKELKQSMTAVSVTAIVYLAIGMKILTLPII